MNDFEKGIIQYWTDEFPEVWSFLWSPENARKIPTEHKDQIHFLNEKGTNLINEFLDSSKMTQGFPFEPFKNYFKNVDEFRLTENGQNEIKKWLHSKEIPFSKYVFIDSDRSGQSVMLTWKMVIKYWEGIFFIDDLVIFDSSLEWGLFYYHEAEIYFGTDKIFEKNEK
ncbi:hypothetical protein [Allomuricauda sp. M10]|uniref:hypothetical protein n=1 Tax=Allomuricauda sp. M10 TaxID=2683292 RepID=UPI001D19079C|nr:hypothetical protein [Muricauda sp. M10]